MGMRRMALIAAIEVVLVTSALCGSVTHSIVITETSSTSLTATYDNSTSDVSQISFNPSFPDTWTIFFTDNVVLANIQVNGSQVQWTEPEDARFANLLGSNGGSRLQVNSDFTANNLFAGTTLQDGQTFANAGHDTTDGGPISIQFFDNAQAAEAVPEPSTLALLVLSSLTLVRARRLRRGQSVVD